LWKELATQKAYRQDDDDRCFEQPELRDAAAEFGIADIILFSNRVRVVLRFLVHGAATCPPDTKPRASLDRLV
jgi:hypothetical protein